MPFGGLLLGGLGAAAGGLLGGGIANATGQGQNTFRASDYTDSNKYDQDAFYYGGSQGASAGEQAYLGSQADKYANRGAIVGDYSGANQSRDQEYQALAGLRNAAQGTTPSAAVMAMQQGNAQAMRNQLATAAGARGAGAMGAAQFNAGQNMANLQSQNIAQSGQLRAQEMANAQNAYMQAAGGIRGADIAQANALAQQRMGSQQQNDLMNRYYSGQQLGLGTDQMQAMMARQQFQAQQHQAADAINAQINAQNAGAQGANFSGMMGGIANGFQGGMMMGAGLAGAGGSGGNGMPDPGY